ncbi:hypothetical protein M2480_000429 [Parabacteroides sp. PFB2-12]|uniref:type I restriction endonuclease n=1 Tax=unclassified Parabacteroides TaxID=2649774 RepID=UPI0024750B8A|nr:MULTISPECIES: type I restriction endonuclease [unclassified Parabacteroides]MDH6342049.1 hypothetical protein [Parabacteroides sp. PM6-13]MDH6389469.1 hypothetical protein [Parabacteroides sp. PFB2-12]
MDLKDVLKQLSERAGKVKDSLQTEEATKNALIMPFIQSLGYDVFNPLEVVPEFICDIGTKKGEKIDYAIMKGDDPILLIECKHCNQDLSLHDNQLLRYFHVTNAKFGILTNGLQYRFYTDLEVPNRMDEKPFFEFNILEIKSQHIEEIKKFHKAYFDVDNILSSASELKYTNELKEILNREYADPSPEFTKFLVKQVMPGSMATAKIIDQFAPLVKKSIASIINDAISDMLKNALNAGVEKEKETPKIEVLKEDEKSVDSKIVTTEEELEAYYIVKSILRQTFPCERITYRDGQTYFSVLVDDNNRKPVCRLYLNSPTNKMISFVGDDKKEIKNKIQSLDEIYNFSSEIIGAAGKFISID